MKKSAFSLVELILYIGITSAIVVVMMLFVVDFVEIRGEAEVDREVLENTRFIMDNLTRYAHDAQSVSTGTFGSHPGSITFTADSGTVVIDTATKSVGDQTIRFMQINTGAGAVQVTSDLVDVTNFVLNDLTRSTEPENIQIEFTIQSLEAEQVRSFRTAISLREQ